MEPAIYLYSPNEKSKLIRENYQEILSVLAAHQIALWEYDIITGKCSFQNWGRRVRLHSICLIRKYRKKLLKEDFRIKRMLKRINVKRYWWWKI